MKKPIKKLLCGVILIFVIPAFFSCGKKGPPVPPKKHVPPVVKNFQYHLNDDFLELTWDVPGKSLLMEYTLEGAVVYRSRIAMAGTDCKDCPPRFKRVANIPTDTDESGTVIKNTMVYRETLKKGYYYQYKVVLYSNEGVSGRDSEYVSFEY